MAIQIDAERYEYGATGDVFYRSASGLMLPIGGVRGAGNIITDQADGVPLWAVNAAGSTPAEVLISTVSPSGTGTVTFSSIPSSYRDLRVVVRGRGDTAATSVEVHVQVNGDTGANYDFEIFYASGNTFSGVVNQGVASTYTRSGDIPGATATASVSSTAEIRFYDYAGTTFQKQWHSSAGVKSANSSGNIFTGHAEGYWRNTAAITSVTPFLVAGNFVSGSSVSLYGIL